MLDKFWQAFLRLYGAATPVSVPTSAPVPTPPELPVSGDPAWLKLARADLGIKEVAGSGSNPDIMRAWKYVDYEPSPDDSKTAWCSAKCNEWTQRAGLPGTRQPNARSWLKWGAGLDKPRPGCITVFWRGSPTGWEGHVALYIGPGAPGKIKVLGGNQSNGVSIAEYPASQLLGYRWPTTGGNSRTLKAQTAGLLLGDGLTIAAVSGKGVLDSLPDALAIGDSVTSLASYWPWAALIGITISILARMVTIWARVSDWQKKGV
jgi:uncharacterized protein (TIGR02594 family)